MAINNSNSSGPMTPAPSQKKRGSGFVSFDKAAEQNKQASQAIGSQIQSNIGQQVQSAQGQVQGATQGIQSQVGAEQQRLGSAEQLANKLTQAPLEVDKAKYKDLTSGQAAQINTQGLQNLQGTLGSSVQAANQLSSSPQARQEALQQVAKRPVAGQSIFGVQRNLDSMLLGRNVNTQDIANQTARQAFNLDRTIGSTIKDTASTQTGLQKQAGQARDVLRGARTAGITSVEDAAKAQAEAYNTDTKNFLDYINNQFGSDMADEVSVKLGVDPNTIQKGRDPNAVDAGTGLAAPSQNKQMLDRVMGLLRGQGIDPTALDITDIGKTEALNLIKQGITGPQSITAQEATTDAQRARLKALYGLEDELAGKDYLNQADVAESLGLDTTALKAAAEKSAANTASARAKYEGAVGLLNKQFDTAIKTNPSQLAGLFSQIDSGFKDQVNAEIERQMAQGNPYDGMKRNALMQSVPAQLAQEYAKDPAKLESARKATLATMEEAARQGFSNSGSIDQIGEFLYKTPDLGTNSGWGRAMSEVQNAFAPYINRKVQSLMGNNISSKNLAGGNYSGPGLAAVRTGGGGGLLGSVGTNIARNIAGSVTAGMAPEVYDKFLAEKK